MKKLLQKLKLKKTNLQEAENLSPNLLSYKTFKPTFIETSQKSLYNFFKYSILFMHILFIVVIGTHVVTNKKIENTLDEIATAELELFTRNTVYQESRRLNNKIKIYKSFDSQRLDVSVKYDDVVSKIPRDTAISTMSFSTEGQGKMIINLEVDNALKVALLITNWLESENISGVVLTDASLNAGSGTYKVSFEIYFK